MFSGKQIGIKKSTSKIQEKSLSIKKLGKGFFTDFYELRYGEDTVYAISTIDTIKEAYSDKSILRKSVKNFPKLESINDFSDKFVSKKLLIDRDTIEKLKSITDKSGRRGCANFYFTEKYEDLSREHTNAYADYLELRRVWKSFHYNATAFDLIPELERNNKLSKKLKKNLITMANTVMNYGNDVKFEVSPRNVKVDKEGNLILLDCFFDTQQIR